MVRQLPCWTNTEFLFGILTGAVVNQPDKYGRTPLHVAAAVDYPEMVQFLVQRGGDIHAKTVKEMQTPVHFAARNDASLSLMMLIKCGADITDKDFKQRTALQVGVVELML